MRRRHRFLSRRHLTRFQVEKCTFNENLNGHILLGTADGKSIVIRACMFEAGTKTTAMRGATAAVDGGGNALDSPVIECSGAMTQARRPPGSTASSSIATRARGQSPSADSHRPRVPTTCSPGTRGSVVWDF